MQQPFVQIPTPTKIHDGLFMGNAMAAADIEWLTLNQVTHIANCAGLDTPSHQYQHQGVQYLVFDWTESQIQTQLFGPGDTTLMSFMQFVHKARDCGGSVLIHGNDSESRACCLLIGYFMKNFGWNLFKTLEFINSRKRDAQLQPQFFQQLNSLHIRLSQIGIIKSSGWEVIPSDEFERLITNTFLNSQEAKQEKGDRGDRGDRGERGRLAKSRKRIGWKDREDRGKIQMEYKYSETEKVSNKEHQQKRVRVKSILKGFPNVDQVDKRMSLEKERPRSSSKQMSSQKESRLSESNLKVSRKNDINSSITGHNKENIKDNRENFNQFFQKNQMIKNRPSTFDRLKKSHSKGDSREPLQWTKTDVKNIRCLDDEIKRKEGFTSSSPIIIVKPNLSMSILHPEPKRSVSEKKNEVLPFSKTQNQPQAGNSDNYMKLLRTKLNADGMEPQLLSLKREIEAPRRERCSSAKPKNQDSRLRESEFFCVNSLSQMQCLSKPKWKH